jgi:hypothetical protein
MEMAAIAKNTVFERHDLKCFRGSGGDRCIFRNLIGAGAGAQREG